MNKTAIISVSDKTNINHIVKVLLDSGYTIYSTGGTYKHIMNKVNVNDKTKILEVSTLTKFPEILNGRVKTLHPKIYGGILAKSTDEHTIELDKYDIPKFNVVIVNLYPFHKVLDNNLSLNEAIELIDIGGVTLLRAAAKNFTSVYVLSDIIDYDEYIKVSKDDINNIEFRKYLALKAFRHTKLYDTMITEYLSDGDIITREYQKQITLKYGCNPHQNISNRYSLHHNMPLKILNGVPGYINILDAINSWQLVKELNENQNLPAAASFKHTSPAGVGLSIPLSDTLKEVYRAPQNLSPLALAYLRARNADPMSSFGDFIALSDKVDVQTAELIKKEVSDGIIAPSYDKEALKILTQKKGGKYIVLMMDKTYKNSDLVEFRDLYGMSIMQTVNNNITNDQYFTNCVTNNKNLTEKAKIDLTIANISLKYSQSNNVAFAYNGQLIGLAAGQQSRVDCVKLAKRKVEVWALRSHPKSIKLFSLFKQNINRQVKINAIVRYIEDDFTEIEYKTWLDLFTEKPESLSNQEKSEYLNQLTEISMASDAFFPFRDSIDHASKVGTRYIMQPGGSTADSNIIEACNQYDMSMYFSGIRVFTH